MKEIGGITTVECLTKIGRKRILARPLRTAAVLVRITADDIVEPLTISRSDIFHIVDIFQASLNLKRCGSGLNQFKQMIALVHILQREKITVMFHLPAFYINE